MPPLFRHRASVLSVGFSFEATTLSSVGIHMRQSAHLNTSAERGTLIAWRVASSPSMEGLTVLLAPRRFRPSTMATTQIEGASTVVSAYLLQEVSGLGMNYMTVMLPAAKLIHVLRFVLTIQTVHRQFGP